MTRGSSLRVKGAVQQCYQVFVPLLGKKLLIYLFDVTGDGRVGCNDLARIARYCCPCCPCCGREEESNESNSDANRHPSLELTSSSQENKSESLSSDTIAVAVHEAVPEQDRHGETKVRALFVFCIIFFIFIVPFFFSFFSFFSNSISLVLRKLPFAVVLTLKLILFSISHLSIFLTTTCM